MASFLTDKKLGGNGEDALMDKLVMVGSDRLRIFQRRGNFSILGAKTTGMPVKLRRWSIRFGRDQEADVKAVIVGSRSIGAVDMDGALSRLRIDPYMVISGGARGVDRIAETWARARGIEPRVLKPDWRRYGRGAALKRNRETLSWRFGKERAGAPCTPCARRKNWERGSMLFSFKRAESGLFYCDEYESALPRLRGVSGGRECLGYRLKFKRPKGFDALLLALKKSLREIFGCPTLAVPGSSGTQNAMQRVFDEGLAFRAKNARTPKHDSHHTFERFLEI